MKRYAVFGIILVVVVAAAGIGGYVLGKQAGAAQAANIRADFLVQRGLQAAPGQGMAGMPGGAPNGGQLPGRDNFASGQVKEVNASVIQLSTALEVVTVETDDPTRIERMGVADLGDIAVGDRITVQGSRGKNGAMTAQSIQIGGPAGAAIGGMPPSPPSSGTN